MSYDMPFSFLRRCVSDILNGLSEGLTLFSGSSRTAVLFALKPDSPLLLCDPQHLLKGHELAFKALYLDSTDWRSAVNIEQDKRRYAEITMRGNLDLAGLLSYGGYSGSVFYQRWFTEHHPDLCSTGPSECWLEHAIWRLSHDLANENELYTGISGYFLKEYATHAVRDHIVDEMNRKLGMDSLMRIYPILDAVLSISRTREEGLWPQGELMFVDTPGSPIPNTCASCCLPLKIPPGNWSAMAEVFLGFVMRLCRNFLCAPSFRAGMDFLR